MRNKIYCGVCKSEDVQRADYDVTCLKCGTVSCISEIPFYLNPDFHTVELGTMKLRVVENFHRQPIVAELVES